MDDLIKLLDNNEDWLIERILKYAKRYGYTKYTSTLEEAWRMSIAGLSASLLKGIRQYSGVPEFGPDEDFSGDPLADFGLIEARRHRERGINIAMFLGLMKYYRQSYVDLLDEKSAFKKKIKGYRVFLERCFDRIEIAFCQEWTCNKPDDLILELQKKNRMVTNEKNKYLRGRGVFRLPRPLVTT